MSVLDKDMLPYHLAFSGDGEDPSGLYKVMFRIMGQALWLSDNLFVITRELNILLFEHGPDDGNWIQFGKEHYTQLAELRTRLERVHASDMLHWHQVKKFLKSKKPSDSYTPIQRSRQSDNHNI